MKKILLLVALATCGLSTISCDNEMGDKADNQVYGTDDGFTPITPPPPPPGTGTTPPPTTGPKKP